MSEQIQREIEVNEHVKALDVTADQQFVTVYVQGQLFGIPVLSVHDVLAPEAIYPIPLAPYEVAGSLNLRGRIVTAINLRRALALPDQKNGHKPMCAVVEVNGEMYSLIVDSVGEVLSLSEDTFENNPGTLDPKWRAYSKGIYRLDGKLLVVLDVHQLLKALNGEDKS